MALPALKTLEIPKPKRRVGRPLVLSVQERKDREQALKERRQEHRENNLAIRARQTDQGDAIVAELRRLVAATELIAGALAASGLVNFTNLTKKTPRV